MNANCSPQSMAPDLANRLFEHGAVLVIAGVPMETEFGIDLCSYKIGESFRGVKMIPPGVHFVWCAATGKYGDVAPRVGFLHFFQAGEILVREWNSGLEELRERVTNEPELEKQRIRENLKDLQRYLAPYDYRFLSEWKQLTDSISMECVQRCQPRLGIVRNNTELQSCADADRPRNGHKQQTLICGMMIEDDLLPKLQPIEGTAPRYTQLPDRVPKDATPTEITRHSMDCIVAVNALLDKDVQNHNIMQEIQLSFALFLLGYSVESLAHWRKLLHILCNSEMAVCRYKLFYMKYAEVLAKQLKRLPDELLPATEHNGVYKDVRSLLINLNLANLTASAKRLSKSLSKSLQWEFVGLLDEDPEDMPVVVESV